MRKRTFPLSRVYRLLEPGPVVLVTTARKGRANILTQSWHTMIDFEPPLLGCIVSDRSYTFGLLKSARECVINIPTVDLVREAVGCGNVSGRKVDKFRRFGLTPERASLVKAPLIGECFASLECKVIDAKMAAKYNLFVLQVVQAWIDPKQKHPRTIHHQGGGRFMVAGRTIRVPSKMK